MLSLYYVSCIVVKNFYTYVLVSYVKRICDAVANEDNEPENLDGAHVPAAQHDHEPGQRDDDTSHGPDNQDRQELRFME